MPTPESHGSEDYISIIEAELNDRRRRNQSYSLRSFAKFLGVSPASLSQILSRKRRLSPKIAARIAERCEFPGPKKSRFMSQVLETSLESKTASELTFHELTSTEFEKISDWYHYAILSLAQIPNSESSPEWIAMRLGITPREAQDAVTRLVEMKLLRSEDGHLARTEHRHVNVQQNTAALGPGAIKFHRQLFEKASKALESNHAHKPLVSAITMAIDPSRLEEARSMIHQFRLEMRSLLTAETTQKVYTLQVSLFPMTVD